MHTSAGNRAIVWALFIIAVLANAAGSLFLYNKIGWYDKAVHLYTTFAVMLLLALLLYGRSLTGSRRHVFLFVLTVMLIGLGIGGLWEIGEYVYDHLIAQKSTIKAKTDTITDLAMDTVGALIAGVVAAAVADK